MRVLFQWQKDVVVSTCMDLQYFSLLSVVQDDLAAL